MPVWWGFNLTVVDTCSCIVQFAILILWPECNFSSLYFFFSLCTLLTSVATCSSNSQNIFIAYSFLFQTSQIQNYFHISLYLKARDQLDHVTSVIVTIVCKVIQKIITKIKTKASNNLLVLNPYPVLHWFLRNPIIEP